MSAEVLRLDYPNMFREAEFSDIFTEHYERADKAFATNYESTFSAEPSKYSYLGYDVMNFLGRGVRHYGKAFIPRIVTQRYTGTGYKFDVTPVMKDSTINYYENTRQYVFRVEEGHQLKKVW